MEQRRISVCFRINVLGQVKMKTHAYYVQHVFIHLGMIIIAMHLIQLKCNENLKLKRSLFYQFCSYQYLALMLFLLFLISFHAYFFITHSASFFSVILNLLTLLQFISSDSFLIHTACLLMLRVICVSGSVRGKHALLLQKSAHVCFCRCKLSVLICLLVLIELN